MKSLVIGAGQVGSALAAVLSEKYEVKIIDKGEAFDEEFDILHICFPFFVKYPEWFKQEVFRYKDKYKPKYIVIHSTVPIGTTQSFHSKNIVHSPIRGKHPNLIPSIKTFVKYVGADDIGIGDIIARYFRESGINVELIENSKNTEFAKIASTTKYGWDIVFMKEMKRICDQEKLNFHVVYTDFTKTYNQGYDELEGGEFLKFHRPVLDYQSGGIGGHCVVQNCDLYSDFVTNLVKERNKIYEEDSI